MKMTKKEFKGEVLNILLNENFGKLGVLFDAEDMSRYAVAQYDREEWDVEATMPLDEFLDELYKEINR